MRSVSDAFHDDVIHKGMDQPLRIAVPSAEAMAKMRAVILGAVQS